VAPAERFLGRWQDADAEPTIGGSLMSVLHLDHSLLATEAGLVDDLPTAHPLVLVVDDDDEVRETLAGMLRSEGLSVVQAGTGAAALELATILPVAAVVLDVMLPDRTGFEVCRALRAGTADRHLPIVLLTALTGIADEATGLLAGADAFVVKPASRARLLSPLRGLL
jgi:DNA-binding response OmpR family regulator